MDHKPYDVAVVIGRCSPYHIGHKTLTDEALSVASHVIFFLGSAYQDRSAKNPWSFAERKAMVGDSHTEEELERMSILPAVDTRYDAWWAQQIRHRVQEETDRLGIAYDPAKVVLVGHSKDASSYYLELFREWQSTTVSNVGNINATSIREKLAVDRHVESVREFVPPAVAVHLSDFLQKPESVILEQCKPTSDLFNAASKKRVPVGWQDYGIEPPRHAL